MLIFSTFWCILKTQSTQCVFWTHNTIHTVGWTMDAWYERITFVRNKATNGKKDLMLSYVFSCRNGHNTKQMYTIGFLVFILLQNWLRKPWRSSILVSLCEVFSAYNPLINKQLYIFGAYTCIWSVLSVEKCVFELLVGSLHSMMCDVPQFECCGRWHINTVYSLVTPFSISIRGNTVPTFVKCVIHTCQPGNKSQVLFAWGNVLWRRPPTPLLLC